MAANSTEWMGACFKVGREWKPKILVWCARSEWKSSEPPRWSEGFLEMKVWSSASRFVRVPTVGRFEGDILGFRGA